MMCDKAAIARVSVIIVAVDREQHTVRADIGFNPGPARK